MSLSGSAAVPATSFYCLPGKMRLSPFLGKMSLVVVFEAEVRDQLFAAEVAEGVLELHDLD